MDFPLQLPVRCKGGREAEVEARPPASKRRMAASGPQARDAPLTRWPTAMLDRRLQPYARQHRSGRRDGLFRSNKGWKEAGSLIVQGFFMPIDYRGSAVEHPQNSCHFSLPTIWSARNSIGDLPSLWFLSK